MSLPKRLTQDESAVAAIVCLVAEYDVDLAVAAYVEDLRAYSEHHRRQVWPSWWSERTAQSIKADFEAWCWGTAWLPGN